MFYKKQGKVNLPLPQDVLQNTVVAHKIAPLILLRKVPWVPG
jgi:hypothetical protein